MSKVIRRILIVLIILAMAGYGGRKAYLILTDQSHMDETFYQVETDKLTSKVRMVFLSDLHLSEFGEDNRDLVERIKQLHPDLILIGGDMNKRQVDDYSSVLSLCAQLLDITDVYYGLGNHEVSRMLTHNRDIYNDLVALGVHVLNNTCEQVQVGDDVLYIGGLTQTGNDIDKYSNGILEKLAEQDGFKLLLSHYPKDFDRSSLLDIDLVLSGHLHGGQVNLPYFDGLVDADGGLFPKYSEGRFIQNDSMLIVSRGLGNSHDLPRVNNPPELVVIDIAPNVTRYNTARLMAEYSASSIPAPTTNAETNETFAESNMLKMMRRMEAENAEYETEALNTDATK